jgi:Na+/H+ antiporter NhaD/arsenite permease-like protein
MIRYFRYASPILALTCATPALAADGAALDGKLLGVYWALPFAGLLLSIAILPLATPQLWHHHYGKIAALWAAAFVLPAALRFGAGLAAHEVLHTALTEYVPFLILVGALFCVTGNIHLKGNLHGAPLLNTGFLALGTALASIMGTTGAAMLLVRPLIRANDDRTHNAHVMVFFIFLVANVGGALTPLGDPPLFLGFLQGVSFFWTLKFLLWPMLLVSGILLGLFFLVDLYVYRREGRMKPDPTPDSDLQVLGGVNFILLGGIVLAVLASGSFKLGAVHVFGIELAIQNLLRDAALIVITLLSFRLTRPEVREANEFSFGPVIEVAKLFAGIFITIIPAIAILRAGREGSLASVVAAVTHPDGTPNNAMYFWLTGGLSSFLDNAPTYLVFFNVAGGDAQMLMGPLAQTLMAISAGAVFMGANSYIGNAPNFMVKAVAESRGVRMPSFFGYMVWSGCVLLPVFGLVTWVFFG